MNNLPLLLSWLLVAVQLTASLWLFKRYRPKIHEMILGKNNSPPQGPLIAWGWHRALAPVTAHPVEQAIQNPDRTNQGRYLAWFTLPGDCIALGNSGFEIMFERSGEWAGYFILSSPEGRQMLANHDLDYLKQKAVQQANFREEFDA